jgi:hypothetical protein
MREYHVRICEGLGVKFPGPTRQKGLSHAARNRQLCPHKLPNAELPEGANKRHSGLPNERLGSAFVEY